jgi:hypothetical protein
MTLHDKLIHAATEYDRRESTRRGYNHYALAHYIEAIRSAESHIQTGADIRQVLVGHFTGRLLSRMLKAAGCSPMTKADAIGGAVRRTQYVTEGDTHCG